MKTGSESWHQLVRGAAEILGVTVERRVSEQFAVHAVEMLAWNRKVNLTAITDPREMALKHFVDALAPLPLLQPGCRLLDIGSGAGFPGIPLKAAMPSLDVTLIDAARKRTHFVRHVIRLLGLKNIAAHHQRSGDLARNTPSIASFDVIVSRAFSSLESFFKEAAPLLAQGGRIIALKGNLAQDELKNLDLLLERKKADSAKGETAFVRKVVPYRLPLLGDGRNLVILTHVTA